MIYRLDAHPPLLVPKDSHIFKKFKGKPPSLIVHLHPTHFRFDQQDGSFSYHSEMRVFIEHLQKGTIPYDMVEEFRKQEVQFYDGWLIVRVMDHRTVNNSASNSSSSSDDGKPFSIHNYNPYITPSPYAPYPTKEQTGQRSPHSKHDHRDSATKDGSSSDAHSDETVAAPARAGKPEPKVYHVGLRPTIMSRHMDLVMDAMAPDPKSLNRKQSQANANSRGGGVPPTPVSGVPATPATEKGPPLKKQKLKIDAKDLLDYEARIVNATAPPLYLDPVDSLEEAEAVVAMLRDPHHDAAPPSAKSRKRTVAELAADDAHAKQQERFMLIMDERNAGNSTGANAGAVDPQAAAGLFQPRFEKFNALESIKREIAERKQREKDRQLQEDENRRSVQEKQAEEDRRRMVIMQRQREQNAARMRQQQEMQQQAHQQAQAQQAQAQRHQQQQQQQASSIPPQMQNQMMAAQARSSPIIRQGTPHAASSPVVKNPQGGQAMAISSSQQGAGSPQRPGSAVQHGHPGVAMARGPSGQGPSRHGTPQIPHSTPGMRNATPVMRQGTPAQHMTQASPHGSMMAPTPQMAHAAAMQNQAQAGMPPQQQQFTAQQMQQIQQRQAMQQQAAMRGQQMVNGTPQMQPAQMAEMHAQQQRQAAMHRMQQQQQQQQAMQQQGTPQTPQMAQSPAQQGTAQYKQQLAEQMKAQMQQASNQGSPAPNQMTPQQQHQLVQQQQQQQQRMMQQNQQGQMMANMNPHMQQQPQQLQQQRQINPQQMPPQMQQFFQNAMHSFQQRYMGQMAQKYGGNTGMLNQQDLAQVNNLAQKAAMQEVQKRRVQAQAQAQSQMAGQQHLQAQQQAAMRQQQQQQGGGMPNGMMNMQGHPNAQGQGGANMNAALLQQQQQQAHHMQQIQMQHAQQMMQHANQQQQQGQGGGGGGSGMQGGMASIQAYQQQLQQMQQQQQQRQG